MPFDLDRIIDNQLYLATQQCIQPHVQQKRVSSAPVPSAAATAAAAGPARAAGARKSSWGSLGSPWSPFSGGGGASTSNNANPRTPTVYSREPMRPHDSSPVDLFFTAPLGIPRRRANGGLYGRRSGDETPKHLARDEGGSSTLDRFVTAPGGDFTTGASAGTAGLLPSLQPRRGSCSRPGSSDTDDDWDFATASGGSASGTCSGLDTTIDLTPSTTPSSSLTQRGKIATRISETETQLAHQQSKPAGPASASAPSLIGASAITLLVPDLQYQKRFYEHLFGAPFLYPSQDGKSAALHLNNGALVITLRESPGKWRRDGADQGVLLSVPMVDIGEVCRRLRSFAGGDERWVRGQDVASWRTAEPVAGPEGSWFVTFSDPAGYRWRVGQNVEGS
jgi:hypothetical protein